LEGDGDILAVLDGGEMMDMNGFSISKNMIIANIPAAVENPRHSPMLSQKESCGNRSSNTLYTVTSPIKTNTIT